MMEAMPYTHSLLSSGKAAAYHAKAAPPTVTMPRLKAMVSGAIGGFLDVAFNFNTQAMLEDNLLDQFYRIGWKLVIHGDETWIKLFPRLFHRQDGVSSFYVKDTVEVDFNVSRHLEAEFASTDWNLLILHYLGLDHVGHIGGRQSILMAPKLKEMDDVIKRVHMNSILDQENSDSRTLLVVVSDHGMTDGGNHGGSSYEETDSLALFIGHGVEESNYSPYNHNEAFQIDIAPTLSLLFGVPIPKNNIGVLLTKLFDSLKDDQRLRSLELNSWQLLRLLKAHLPGLHCGESSCYSCEKGLETNVPTSDAKQRLCHLFSKAVSAHNFWRFRQHSDFISADIDYFQVAADSYNDFLRNASEWLSHKATDILFSVIYFSAVRTFHGQWVEVAAIYFLGLAGHFGLGNTNSLATIDVAGAFIGISSHSTVFSGILMFIITYASPLLSYLSMVMYIAMKDITFISSAHEYEWSCFLEKMIALPCLLPLLINSLVLTSFTIILLLMRNHLFVWSVFSPKYLYVCAATVCVYIGVFIVAATGLYTYSVFYFRTRNLREKCPEVMR